MMKVMCILIKKFGINNSSNRKIKRIIIFTYPAIDIITHNDKFRNKIHNNRIAAILADVLLIPEVLVVVVVDWFESHAKKVNEHTNF